jgi:protein SCO1/2
MKAGAVFLFGVLSATAAQAGLPQADLSTVEAAPPLGARLDTRLMVKDVDGTARSIADRLAGRPGFVIFVDYTCNTLCGTELALLSAAIEGAALDRSGFHILVMGIDPKDSPLAARATEDSEMPPDLKDSASFLLPKDAMVAQMTAALGYRFIYDAAIDQFAHPAAVYVIATDGAVLRVLTPIDLTVDRMKDVFSPSIPTLVERIHLLCYAYDPATGIYTPRIELILKVGAAITLGLLGSAILLLRRRTRVAR